MNPPNNSDLTPILDPILSLLRSRKFIVAAVIALVDTLIIAVPSLLPVRGELLAVITTLAVAIIGTTAAEDMGKVHEAAKIVVAKHQADAVVASAHVMANKAALPVPDAEGDTKPFPPYTGAQPRP